MRQPGLLKLEETGHRLPQIQSRALTGGLAIAQAPSNMLLQAASLVFGHLDCLAVDMTDSVQYHQHLDTICVTIQILDTPHIQYLWVR